LAPAAAAASSWPSTVTNIGTNKSDHCTQRNESGCSLATAVAAAAAP